MLLRNYYKAFAGAFQKPGASTFEADVVNTSGTVYRLARPSNEASCAKLLNALSFSGMHSPAVTDNTANAVVFGDGTTPVSLDDYTLSGNKVTGIATVVTSEFVYDDDGVYARSVFTVTNQNDAAITIGEVGYVGTLYRTTSTAMNLLLDRTVLETPVTIEPGGVGQVVYTIRINYPW